MLEKMQKLSWGESDEWPYHCDKMKLSLNSETEVVQIYPGNSINITFIVVKRRGADRTKII